MESLLSKNFLPACALIFPLFQCLIQVLLISTIGAPRLHRILSSATLLLGTLSLMITLVVLGFFFSASEEDRHWILYYKSKIPLRFTFSYLGLLFWSSKNVMVFLIEVFSLRYFFREAGIGKFYFM